MRMTHYLILGLSAVLPACASSPVRCDGRLQPVNPPVAVGPVPTAAPVAPVGPPSAEHAPLRNTP